MKNPDMVTPNPEDILGKLGELKDQKGEVVCDFVAGTEACDIASFVKQ